jgi:hypothetical protein
MPILTGCSERARIGNGAQTALAVHARLALRMARRPIRDACGDAAFRAFWHKLSAPDQPDQSLVALAYVGKARDGMCRRHRDEEQSTAGYDHSGAAVWAPVPAGAELGFVKPRRLCQSNDTPSASANGAACQQPGASSLETASRPPPADRRSHVGFLAGP